MNGPSVSPVKDIIIYENSIITVLCTRLTRLRAEMSCNQVAIDSAIYLLNIKFDFTTQHNNGSFVVTCNAYIHYMMCCCITVCMCACHMIVCALALI